MSNPSLRNLGFWSNDMGHKVPVGLRAVCISRGISCKKVCIFQEFCFRNFPYGILVEHLKVEKRRHQRCQCFCWFLLPAKNFEIFLFGAQTEKTIPFQTLILLSYVMKKCPTLAKMLKLMFKINDKSKIH